MEEGCNNFEEHDIESLDCYKGTIIITIDIKNIASKNSEESEDHLREILTCLSNSLICCELIELVMI